MPPQDLPLGRVEDYQRNLSDSIVLLIEDAFISCDQHVKEFELCRAKQETVAEMVPAIPTPVDGSENGMTDEQDFQVFTYVMVEQNPHAVIFNLLLSKKWMIERMAFLSAWK